MLRVVKVKCEHHDIHEDLTEAYAEDDNLPEGVSDIV